MRCALYPELRKWGIYPTFAHEFQGFRVWEKNVFPTLKPTAIASNLAYQVKEGHAVTFRAIWINIHQCLSKQFIWNLCLQNVNCFVHTSRCQIIAACWCQIALYNYKADSRLAPSQWETSLQSNAVSHWLSASLESTQQLGHHPFRQWLVAYLKGKETFSSTNTNLSSSDCWNKMQVFI